ncbi:MAG TPA: ferritin-like domain-containing protein [Polyangiaceae bacterium]|nr:ferritin-like domain-containing protein [Polyangiaceae bacterium]
MNIEKYIRRAFFRRLVSTREGRVHLLNLMIKAEEGDEAGVFDRLQEIVDDPTVRKTIARHQADECEHAALYRKCLERHGGTPGSVPSELLIIRRVAFAAGGAFASASREQTAKGIVTREDIMKTYALLLAIEERGVEQFPLIGREFRRIGDHETADTFERIARDELRHTKYCRAIGRRFAPDDAAWAEAVAEHRAVEARAFHQAALAGVAYAIEQGLAWNGVVPRLIAAALHRLDPMRRASPVVGATASTAS